MLRRFLQSPRIRSHGTISACVVAAVSILFSIGLGPGSTDARVQLPQHPATHRVPAIDGAQNPELIPDPIVYSLFFRTIAHTPNPEGRRRVRAYLKSAVLAPRDLQDGAWRPATDDELTTLLTHIEQYREGLVALDAAQVKARADRNALKVAELRNAREHLLMEFVAELPGKAGDYAGTRVQSYITQKFRTKIRIFE